MLWHGFWLKMLSQHFKRIKKYHLKEKGKVEGIIAAVYQSAFGEDCFPSLEEKAANQIVVY